MYRLAAFFLALAAAAVPAAANAGELFGGLYVHDVRTPLDRSGIEGGMDVMLGWRGEKIARTPLQPYVFAAVNTAGNTNYGAVGLSAKFGDRIYFRPGLGIAVHTGSSGDHFRNDKIAFGSRLLFEPEIAVGTRISDAYEPRPTVWARESRHGQFRCPSLAEALVQRIRRSISRWLRSTAAALAATGRSVGLVPREA